MKSFTLEVRYEFLKLIRTPVFLFSILLSPLLFYSFFGIAMGRQHHVGTITVARFLLATYGTFGVLGSTLFGFGANLAVERGLGWLQLKRASPMRPASYFAAKAAVSILFSVMVVGLLFFLGAAFGEVRMPAVQWLELGTILIAGSLPFCALSLAVGYVLSAQAAPGIVNLMYMSMSLFSGLWVPLMYFPVGLQKFAPALPAYHLSQLALAVAGGPSKGTPTTHILALTAFTLLFMGLAWMGYYREQEGAIR